MATQTFLVNSTADTANDPTPIGSLVDGVQTGTLREALNFANATTGEVDISFAANVQSVTLTKELPVLTGDAVTNGGGTVTINGNGFRPFIVGDAGTTTRANTPYSLTLQNITVTGGKAQGGAGTDGGGGGAGLGGAVLVTSNGALTLNGATLTNNSATGGAGGPFVQGVGGGGGLGSSGGTDIGGGGGLPTGSPGGDTGGTGGGTNPGQGSGPIGGSASGTDGGFGGGGGGAYDGHAGSPDVSIAGDGGFGGGGGASNGFISIAGAGGFGGGGGAARSHGTAQGGAGGFGGGGGGVTDGNFSTSLTPGLGGFAAGSASGTQGGGGAGLGGAVFVQAGGTISISGNTTESGGSVSGGNEVVGGMSPPYAGSSYGSGFFFQGPVGSTQTVTFGNGTQSIADDIADYLGSPGSTANSANLANQGGSLALAKSGTGTLTLSGANTYTGATTVTGGTLLIDGSTATASAVTVASSSALGGSGTLGGTVMVSGTLSASAKAVGTTGTISSIGTLTTGALTLNNGSIFREDVTGPASADLVKAAGVSFGPGVALDIEAPAAFTTAAGQSVTLIDNTSGNPISGAFTSLDLNGINTAPGPNNTFQDYGRTYQLSYTGTASGSTPGNDVTLTDITPSPPSGGGGGGPAVGTPTASAQTTTTAENTADSIVLTGSDPDSPALPLTYAITTQPTDGTLSNFNAATGAVTYTPNAGYVGPDSFAFTDSNGTNTSQPAMVTVGVTPPPTIAFDPTVTTLGSTVTLTGTVSAATGVTVAGVELFLGKKDIGAATLNGDGTWTYDFDQDKGFHTGITAVATDSQGLQTSAPSDYDLTTGVTGEPYKVVQDRYDASADFLGQDFFKPSGVVYLKSTYAALPDGGSSFTYKGGSFFDGKDYTSFTDNLTANGDLTTHIEDDKDGSHGQEIDANKQTVTALGNDTFADYASSTRFIFSMNDGEEAIYGFKATGADHDTLQLSSGAGTLAQVLAKATSDGQGGTMLHVGTGETVDLINITKAELKAHHSDFSFSAGTTA